MRRVSAASLVTINPMVRPDRDVAGKDGDVTEMFAEAIKVPACVVPAAEPAPAALARPLSEPLPAPAPALAELGLAAAAVPALAAPVPALAAPPPDAPEPARPTWHGRMTRAIIARFRRAPSEDEATGDAKERLERFQSRRLGPKSLF